MSGVTITDGRIAHVAREGFGGDVEVESVSEIRPVSEFGIPRISGCNANLSFRVKLRDNPKPYVFRFGRGPREDFYDKEAENYRLIAEQTDIPVPGIHRIDKSKTLVPVSYMVMDYMTGEESFFLSDPRNPQTEPHEKAEIQRETGYCYAQIHNISRKASSPRSSVDLLLYRIEQLEHVVTDGQFCIDLERINQCKTSVEADRNLLIEHESLCVNDSELHFRKRDGDWTVSFICDMEHVQFGDPYLDLIWLISAPKRLWECDHPLILDQKQVAQMPCVRGYEVLRQIDYEKLSRVAVFSQLEVMCAIAGEVYRPEKREYMKSREKIYIELVEVVAGLTG